MSCPVALEIEIRYATKHLSFGVSNIRSVDTHAWADQCERIGANGKWAIEWINAGYPEPPDWVKRLPAKAAELWPEVCSQSCPKCGSLCPKAASHSLLSSNCITGHCWCKGCYGWWIKGEKTLLRERGKI